MNLFYYVFILFCSLSIHVKYAQDIVINELMSSNTSVLLDNENNYVDWIELYNTTNSPINLNSYYLSDDSLNLLKWKLPSIIIQPSSFQIIFASSKNYYNGTDAHTNFKLNYTGEKITLYNPSNLLLDSIVPIKLKTNESYGRVPDGQTLGKMWHSSPGVSNNQTRLKNVVSYSHPTNQIYENEFYLKIYSQDTVYYTLDGSEPNINSFIYQDSLLIQSGKENNISNIPTNNISNSESEFGFIEPEYDSQSIVTLRLRTFKNGTYSNEIQSRSYLVGIEPNNLPIISIVTDSSNLFDLDSGIYVPGNHFDDNNIDWSGNYFNRGNNWERKAAIMYFDSDGTLLFNEDIGIRVSGNATRKYPQKSLRVYFRSKYGRNKIENCVFKNRNYNDLKRFTLRTSYSYWFGRNTLFQDELITEIAKKAEMDLDHQEYTPAVLYLNGEYWGIHNVRERQDKYYLSALHGVEKDSLNILEDNLSAVEGEAESYVELVEFISNNDMKIKDNYTHVTKELDLDNYIRYFVIETYFGNLDWPSNNFRMWRERGIDKKWRFLLYDLDAAIHSPDLNSFDFLKEGKTIQGEMFLSLLKNDEFKSSFKESYIHFLKYMKSENSFKEIYTNLKSSYNNELVNHSKRWGNPKSIEDWNQDCQYLVDYAKERNCYLVNHLEEFLDTNIDLDCKELKSNKVVHIYPNPSKDFIKVSVDEKYSFSGTITIMNCLGQNVLSKVATSNFIRLNVQELKSGIYLVKLQSKELNYTQKIIVE